MVIIRREVRGDVVGVRPPELGVLAVQFALLSEPPSVRRSCASPPLLSKPGSAGSPARSAIARLTGLSPASVTGLTAELAELAERGIGCLPATTSESRLVERAFSERVIDTRSIGARIAAARAGNPPALRLFQERARLVGRVLAMLMDVINPEVAIVVEPGVARFASCLAALRSEVQQRISSRRACENAVLPRSFPNSTSSVMAGSVALDAFYRNPLVLRGIR